jgi:hypothetical protein
VPEVDNRWLRPAREDKLIQAACVDPVDHEGRLEGVLRGVVIAQHSATHAKDHCTVPMVQSAESGISSFPVRQKKRHDLVIREPDHIPAVEQVFNPLHGCTVKW